MKVDKILRYVLLGGVFFLPVVPLIISQVMFFPFITGKNFAFRIAVEIFFGAWIIYAWRNPEYRPRFTWILAAAAAFLSVTILADLAGVNFFRSFWSNYERMEGLFTHLHLFAYLVAAGSVLNSRKLWGTLFHISLGVSLIIAFYSILQLTGQLTINQGGVRVDGTFGNATYLASYLLFHIFLAFFVLLREKKKVFLRVLYGGIALLHTIILINTASRGVILGFIVGIFLTALLISLLERERYGIKWIALGVIVFVTLFVGLFITFRDSSFIRENKILKRFANVTLTEGRSRFMVWNMAWEGFKERPILGWGEGNFIILFNKHYNPQMYSQEPWFDRAHDIIFDRLIAGGALGLLSYLSIFGAIFYYIWFSRKNKLNLSVAQKSVLSGLLAAYFFQNLFVFDNIVSYLLFFSILGFLHTEALSAEKEEKKAISFPGGRDIANRVVSPLVIIAVIALIYSANVRNILANKELLQGLAPQEGGIAQNLEHMRKSLDYGSIGTVETREQIVQTAISISQNDVPVEFKQAYFDLASEEMQKQIERVPGNARYHLFLATMLSIYQQYDAAIEVLNAGIEVSPKKQQLFYGLGNAYVNKGEYENAMRAAKQAFVLEENNLEARKIYAVSAILAGKQEIADELLIPVLGSSLIPEPPFINAYNRTEQFDKVAAIWEKRVLEEPGNTQYGLSLAAAYLKLGDSGKAVAQIERLIGLDPSFEEEGNRLINEIWAGNASNL